MTRSWEFHCQVLAEELSEKLLFGWEERQLQLSPLFTHFTVTVGDTHPGELYGSPLLINMRKLMHGKMGLDVSLTLSHPKSQTRICQRRMLWICWWNISHTEYITTLVKRLCICLLQVILSSSSHWIASKSSIIRFWPYHKDNMEEMIWHVRIWQHLKTPCHVSGPKTALTVLILASHTDSTSISGLIVTGLHFKLSGYHEIFSPPDVHTVSCITCSARKAIQ